MTKPFKYPDCPKGFTTCGFKVGELEHCDEACNQVVASEPCSRCKESSATCTVYHTRVCYDCAAALYEERTGIHID